MCYIGLSLTLLNIKIIETPGPTIQQKVQKSDPFPSHPCNDNECPICPSQLGTCRLSNITYKIECNMCKYIYIGETATNAYTRGKEHMNAYRLSKMRPPKQDELSSSVLYNHTKGCHDSENPLYTMSVTGRYGTALTRQVAESVKINNHAVAHLMNSRREWNHTRMVKSTLSTH